METFKTIIDSLHKDLLYLILYFQGEPLKNTLFPDFVKYAVSRKIYTTSSTNGHFLYSSIAKKIVESGLDRLIVSVDGTDQQTYASYRRGGELKRVLEGISNIVHWKKELKSNTPLLIMQFVVFKHNEHQIPEILKMGKDLGVDKVELKSAQVYTLEKGEEIVSGIERFARYKKGSEGKYTIKSELPDKCLRMWRGCVFTWDGRVVPCCFDKDASYQFGSVKKESFRHIWRSAAYNSFRDQILSSRKEIDICRNCSEGLNV
jgi:radical SAM protein with 4Fe4S-binding SPASM domain